MSRARAVLAEAMAQIEARLTSEHVKTTNVQESTQAAIENLRYDVVTRPGDIGRVLEQVSAMCALVAERIEADRLERRALSEAIALLANGNSSLLEGASPDLRSRVIGGTVLASDAATRRRHHRSRGDRARDDRRPAGRRRAVDAEPVDLGSIDVEPVETAVLLPEALVVGASAPDTIDLEAEAVAPLDSGVDSAIWNAFDKPVDATAAPDTLDLRPRRGTRLTAGRSNRDASWR